MFKFLFVTLLAVTASSFSMDNLPFGNDIASYINNEPAYSSCDSHEVDWGGPDLVSTSTQEMADNTYPCDVVIDPSK